MRVVLAAPSHEADTEFTNNQKNYLAKRVQRLAAFLHHYVSTHVHKNMSVGYKLNLMAMNFSMDVSLNAKRKPRQYLAQVEGVLELAWAHQAGHGKNLKIGASVSDAWHPSNTRALSLQSLDTHAQIRDFANQIIHHLTQTGALPAIKDKDALEAWMTVKELDFQPWKMKKRLREHFDAQVFLTPEKPLDSMFLAVQKAVTRWEGNFKRRYAIRNNIFDNVDFNYNALSKNLELKLNLNNAHASAERKLSLKGPVSVSRSDGKLSFFFTPETGLPLQYQGDLIEIGGKNTSEQLMRIVMDSGAIRSPETLFQPGQANAKTQRTRKRRMRSQKMIFNDMADNDNYSQGKHDERFERSSRQKRYERRTSKAELKKSMSLRHP